jgi:hypothetical protein
VFKQKKPESSPSEPVAVYQMDAYIENRYESTNGYRSIKITNGGRYGGETIKVDLRLDKSTWEVAESGQRVRVTVELLEVADQLSAVPQMKALGSGQ